ncbi:MAG: GTP-binding protein, partial [Kibdelosporangium sp.]
DEMLGRLAEPSARIDVIVIEASGLADPQTMVRMLLASKVEGIRYGGLVTVLDAVQFPRTHHEHPDLARQLKIADLLVLNKTDLVADTSAVIGTIRAFNGDSPILPVTHGRIDPDLLFDGHDRPVARQMSFEDLLHEDHLLDNHGGHAHAVYDTVSFSTTEPMHPVLLMDFLDNRPAGLYRLKGFVYFGLPGYADRFGVQTVGDYLRFHREPWPRGQRPMTQLVLIGKDIDESAVQWLTACARTGPVDEGDMLWVTRYLVDAAHEPAEHRADQQEDESVVRRL